jgi:hypothetical protein
VTAAAGRTGTVERTAACEAGRHHLCRGTIVADAAHSAPAAAPATAATCGDLSRVGLGQPGTPMRVNVLARDESIAFLGKRTRINKPGSIELAELLGTCRWRWRRPPPTSRRPGPAWSSAWRGTRRLRSDSSFPFDHDSRSLNTTARVRCSDRPQHPPRLDQIE